MSSNNFPSFTSDAPAPALVKLSSSSDSSNPAAKKFTSFKPHKLLYPLRESQKVGELGENSGGLLLQTQWVGLTPLDMVQEIVSLAEMTSPEFGSELPLRCSSLKTFLACREIRDNQVGDKRKCDHIEEGDDPFPGPGDDDEAEARAELLVESNVDINPDRLNDSIVTSLEATGEGAARKDSWKNGQKRFAADPKKACFIPSYNRIAYQLVSSNDSEDAVKRFASQMRALSEIMSSVEAKAEPLVSSAKRRWRIVPRRTQPFSRPVVLTKKETSNMRGKRDAFQACMISWLKHNFVNPFPDEMMLNRLANYLVFQLRCISLSKDDAEKTSDSILDLHQKLIQVAKHKVSTWLVNIRTRRWRVAIETAFDAKRPVALLLEDSLRVFEKKKLRPIRGWNPKELFAFEPLYLTPLKTWDKPAKKKVAAQGKRSVETLTELTKACVLNKSEHPPPLNLTPPPLHGLTPPPFNLTPPTDQTSILAAAAAFVSNNFADI
ncbi:hypothetical protein ACHAWF_011687 [Thalassiosira exigua]